MIRVMLTDNWRLYASRIPDGMSPLGVVSRGGADTGALCVVKATGLYVQVNAEAVRTLPQRDVRKALERPPDIEEIALGEAKVMDGYDVQ